MLRGALQRRAPDTVVTGAQRLEGRDLPHREIALAVQQRDESDQALPLRVEQIDLRQRAGVVGGAGHVDRLVQGPHAPLLGVAHRAVDVQLAPAGPASSACGTAWRLLLLN